MRVRTHKQSGVYSLTPYVSGYQTVRRAVSVGVNWLFACRSVSYTKRTQLAFFIAKKVFDYFLTYIRNYFYVLQQREYLYNYL